MIISVFYGSGGGIRNGGANVPDPPYIDWDEDEEDDDEEQEDCEGE